MYCLQTSVCACWMYVTNPWIHLRIAYLLNVSVAVHSLHTCSLIVHFCFRFTLLVIQILSHYLSSLQFMAFWDYSNIMCLFLAQSISFLFVMNYSVVVSLAVVRSSRIRQRIAGPLNMCIYLWKDTNLSCHVPMWCLLTCTTNLSLPSVNHSLLRVFVQ